MTTQTPDAVREALEKRKAVNTVLGRLLAPLVPDAVERMRIGNEACTLILAALDSRAGDAGEGLKQQTHEWRRREVQAIGAAISTRSWHAVEQAYNSLRDKMDAAGCWHAPATPAPAVDAQEVDDEGPCTDCEDTGITIQTERACSCEAGDQYRAPAADAVPAGEAEATQTFELRWTGAARPPVHPTPMSGCQRFTSFERAVRFMLNQPSDAKFVSLHADVARRYDRTADMQAALDADARLDAALSHGEGRK